MKEVFIVLFYTLILDCQEPVKQNINEKQESISNELKKKKDK